MNILIIGNGGREHALADVYSRSTRTKRIFVAPGNDLMPISSSKIECVSNINVLDFDKIIDFCKLKKIDFVDVAQDIPISKGLVDILAKQSIPAFGPTRSAAELEWSKVWSREFMTRHSLPAPEYKYFSDSKKAINYIKKSNNNKFYVKASGLALGKGAIGADSKKAAIEAVKSMADFGNAGKNFLVEEKMIGEEFSIFAICDGKDFIIAGSAQDHKTVYTGSIGPNTGGMGCIAPASNINNSLLSSIKRNILNPLLKNMHDEGRTYSGILYLGGMIVDDKIKIIEFNARWGDPEAQVILPGLETDYCEIIQNIFMEDLKNIKVEFDRKTRISIAGCALGYPGNIKASMDKKIYGLDLALDKPGIKIYGAGIKRKGKHFVVNGGRVFHLVAEGRDVLQARERAYSAIANIHIEGNSLHYRTDIGFKALERISA